MSGRRLPLGHKPRAEFVASYVAAAKGAAVQTAENGARLVSGFEPALAAESRFVTPTGMQSELYAGKLGGPPTDALGYPVERTMIGTDTVKWGRNVNPFVVGVGLDAYALGGYSG